MTKLADVDFSKAEISFAVANTPLFLIRKLRVDPAVRELSELGGDQLMELLKASVRVKPKTLTDAVRPYVYLVALSMKDEITYLRRSIEINPSPEDEWFIYIRNVLIETYRPTSTQVFQMDKPTASIRATQSTTVFS